MVECLSEEPVVQVRVLLHPQNPGGYQPGQRFIKKKLKNGM